MEKIYKQVHSHEKHAQAHKKHINPCILHSQKGISNISQQGGVHINMQDLIQSIFRIT